MNLLIHKKSLKAITENQGNHMEWLLTLYDPSSVENHYQDRKAFIQNSNQFWVTFRGSPFFSRHPIEFHPSVEKDLSLKIEVRDQTIWTSTPEL